MNYVIAQEKERLDRAIATAFPDFSRSQLQKVIKEKGVLVNGTLTQLAKYPLEPGDRVEIELPEPDPTHLQAATGQLAILYEDEALLVINKSAGIITHPNDFHSENTVAQLALAHVPAIAEAVYDPENPVSRLRPGIVHRLDKDTTGVLVIAKTSAALHHLAEQFRQRTIQKTYQAVLYGRFEENRTVNAPIQRKGGEKKNRMVASHDPSQGRGAVTHFRPLQQQIPRAHHPNEVISLVEASIETGRTHQIRVHAKFIGHPVLGDSLYTNKPASRLSEALNIRRQLLHAANLELTHPITGERQHFSAPLPPDMASLFPALTANTDT